MQIDTVLNKIQGLKFKLWSFAAHFVVRLRLRLRVCGGEGLRCSGLPIIRQNQYGQSEFGRNVVLVSRSRGTAPSMARSIVLRCLTPSAVISIGDDSGLSGATVCAAQSVTIGARCQFGADVLIFDTNFYNHDWRNRRYREPDWLGISKPVNIGNDVFIRTRPIVQKGVSVGDGAIVAAGSIVMAAMPPHTIVAGNRALVIRELVELA